MKNFFTILLTFLVVTFQVFAGEFQTIDESHLKKIMQNKDYILIDIRTPEEIVRTGKIPGAKVKNYHDFDFGAYLKQLDKAKKYVVYCHSGGRSASAAKQMSQMGLEVLNLGGGITGWLKANNKTEKSQK